MESCDCSWETPSGSVGPNTDLGQIQRGHEIPSVITHGDPRVTRINLSYNVTVSTYSN